MTGGQVDAVRFNAFSISTSAHVKSSTFANIHHSVKQRGCCRLVCMPATGRPFA